MFSLDVVPVGDIHQLRMARWERIRQRGLWRFAFVQGVLLYGGLLWLAFAVMAWSRYALQDWTRFVVIAAVGAVIGGFVFGILMYFFTMWTYRRYKTRFS